VPQAGDVVSFGTTVPGHTAVVTNATVDANGNGAYTTLNENVGNQAVITFDIIQWLPTTTRGGRSTGIPPVTNWLHDPRAGSGRLGPGVLAPGSSGAGAASRGTPSAVLAAPDRREITASLRRRSAGL
jgi:hypothetical protein